MPRRETPASTSANSFLEVFSMSFLLAPTCPISTEAAGFPMRLATGRLQEPMSWRRDCPSHQRRGLSSGSEAWYARIGTSGSGTRNVDQCGRGHLNHWFNTAAFSTDFAQGQLYENTSRNSIPGPGLVNVGLSLSQRRSCSTIRGAWNCVAPRTMLSTMFNMER